MHAAIVYEISTGRIMGRYICSSKEQLNIQEISPGCTLLPNTNVDPNEFKVVGAGASRRLQRLADHEKGPIVR